MRQVSRASAQYVCLPCLLRGRKSDAVNLINPLGRSSLNYISRPLSASSICRQNADTGEESVRQAVQHKNREMNTTRNRVRLVSSTKQEGNSTRKGRTQGNATAADANNSAIELSNEQMKQLQAAHRLRSRLNIGISRLPGSSPDALNGLPLEDVLKAIPAEHSPPDEARLLGTLQQVYEGRRFAEVTEELAQVLPHRNHAQRKVQDVKTKQILAKLGLFAADSTAQPTSTNIESAPEEVKASTSQSMQIYNDIIALNKPTSNRRQSLLQGITRHGQAKQATPKKAKTEKPPPFPAKAKVTWTSARDLQLKPVVLEKQPRIPELSFDLSRVLFNPGIYHLQDPRSRVYNFDPYLEQPMPLSEFNFDALNAYVTSSEDQDLLSLARNLDKRYIGSSSSMSGALSQFHFLLSNWRELNTDHMSKGFAENRKDYTAMTRAPSAIFLRYRDGVYAVDADKEFDTPNVLMSLGKSLEKLLTLEKEELEKWRRTHTSADTLFSDPQDEAFHYSEQGSFLLRSQLDAYDPRLPGTGVFDLKTRAVAGIRMNIRAHEHGMGYQIKERFGIWESFEREYYDMMRATFLKYSMQVRMGKMDGIFVAYHNIERIFGFQYIPLSDMDHALHGQRDPCLGDQEFRFSVDLMKAIFDKVTEQHPKMSVRFHFETREPSASEPKPYMNVFAEPMTNEEIDDIQKRHHEEFAAFEKRVFSGQDQERQPSDKEVNSNVTEETLGDTNVMPKDEMTGSKVDGSSEVLSSTDEAPLSSSTAANTAFLDKMMDNIPADVQPKGPRPILAFKLSVQNVVNDFPVARPENISPTSQWSVGYTMEQLSDESARRQYIFCKNRRMSALSASKTQSGVFIQRIRDLSSQGAEWRRKQDEVDAQRETVVLYQDQVQN